MPSCSSRGSRAARSNCSTFANAAPRRMVSRQAPKHPLGDFLQAVQQQAALTSVDGSRCVFCHTTMSDFRATGRWGCARCYTTFEHGMRELLRRVHGSAKHIGKAYRPPQSETIEREAALGELRERLRRAIESEQFELAADLRDRIKVLE